jgi:hypothetical protein
MVQPMDAVWLDENAFPRCFILDEQHNVILACSPHPKDPLNARFMPNAHGNRLPEIFDHLVAMLENACAREQHDSESAVLANASAGPVRVNVQPLHGPWGNHTTVIIEHAELQ